MSLALGGHCGHYLRVSHRLLTVIGVVLLAIAVSVAAQPLDSGDNFCGNAFVSRGSNHEFNGCDVRLTQQRLATGSVGLVGIGCLLVVARRRTTA